MGDLFEEGDTEEIVDYHPIYTDQKPDVAKAPKWANWLAQDEDGEWSWFRHKPIYDPFVNMCGAWIVVDNDEEDEGDDEYEVWSSTGIHTFPPRNPEEMLFEIKR